MVYRAMGLSLLHSHILRKRQRQADWAVVRARYVGMNIGVDDERQQVRRNKKVVEPPADIALAGGRDLRPPRVLGLSRPDIAECVDQPGGEKLAQRRALLGQKAGGLTVLARPRQVDFGVGRVQI